MATPITARSLWAILLGIMFGFALGFAVPVSAVDLPADAPECARWAAADVDAALRERSIAGADIVVTIGGGVDAPPEGFDIDGGHGRVSIAAGDGVGAMYGLFELADRIRAVAADAKPDWSAIAAAVPRAQRRPFLEVRADNPYLHCVGNSLTIDVEMWCAYIDQLARCRFNLLDLHGGYDPVTTGFPNLFKLLVDHPDQLAALKTIIEHGQRRGVKVALMNYSADLMGAEQMAQAVAQIIAALPGLDRIGFRASVLTQAPDFYLAAYVKGVHDSVRPDMQVYTRSWRASKKMMAEIATECSGRLDIEIKYNGEQLGLPWHALTQEEGGYTYEDYVTGSNDYRIIWEMRANGTHRFWTWAQSDFIRHAVRSCRFGGARGFSLEPAISFFKTAAAPYYQRPEDQGVYRWIWQKHWPWYLAWGRLAYDPGLADEALIAVYRQRFGAAAPAIYRALQASGWAVPLACAYRYQGEDHRWWSPETESGCFIPGTTNWTNSRLDLAGRGRVIGLNVVDPLGFALMQPMDRQAFAGIGDFARVKLGSTPDGRFGPAAVAEALNRSAQDCRAALAEVGEVPAAAAAGWRLMRADLECATFHADFYAARILGVTHLQYAVLCGSTVDYQKAVARLIDSRVAWQGLALVADGIYAPLPNPLRAETAYRWTEEGRLLDRLDALMPALWQRVKPNAQAQPLVFTDADRGRDLGIVVRDFTHLVDGPLGTISAKVTAPAGVAKVILWFKRLPATMYWNSQPMDRDGADGFALRLPIDRNGLMYFLEIQTNDGATRNFPLPFTTQGWMRPYQVIPPAQFKDASF